MNDMTVNLTEFCLPFAKYAASDSSDEIYIRSGSNLTIRYNNCKIVYFGETNDKMNPRGQGTIYSATKPIQTINSCPFLLQKTIPEYSETF